MRVTEKNIVASVEALQVQLVREGYTKAVHLHHGKPSVGLAWRLYFEDGSEVPGLFRGYLGWTKEEAWHTLSTMIRLMSDLWNH